MSESTAIAITTVFSILAILGILGNFLVCVIIKRNRDMRKRINYLIMNLAVADILFSMFIAPYVFFVKLSFVNHPGGMTGSVLCKLLTSGVIGWIGATSSFVTLAVIAVERYYVVVYPLGKKRKLTKGKLKVIISGSWIFSVILNIPPLIIWNFDQNKNLCVFTSPGKWTVKAYLLLWKMFVVFTMALLVVLYTKVVYTLWCKSKDEEHQVIHGQRRVTIVRKRVTLMAVTISVIFGICWGTDTAVYLIKYMASYNVGPVPIAIANTMVLFNSAANPFVYALLNKQFREKVKKMVCCTDSSTPTVHRARQSQDMEFLNIITYPTHTTESFSQE